MMSPRLSVIALLLLAGCSKPAPDAPANVTADSLANLPVTETPALNVAAQAPPESQNTDDPDAFVPTKSQKVLDAIHLALDTGQTQRWEDGKLSGYAVPSTTPGANGCRAVRYTVDQRKSGTFESITACNGSR